MSTATVSRKGVLALGATQARTEIRNRFARPSALTYLVLPAILVAVFTNVDIGSAVGGAAAILAGIATATLFIGGFVGIAGELVTEQDDGTMLRVRTLPHGLLGYLMGKTMSLLVSSLVSVLLILIPAHFLVTPILPTSPAQVAAFVGLAALTLFAAVPLGSVIGSLLKSPLAVMPVSLLAYGLMLVSGIFFPVAMLPDWVALPVKAFPLYWLGMLGRTALVPGTEPLATSEALLATGVPVLWGILGLLLAPRALRIMTRRQSGSRLEALAARRHARGY